MERHLMRQAGGWAAAFAVAALVAAFNAPSVFANAPAPDVVPSCYSPQPLNPLMPVGGTSVSARNGIVWNGTEYVVAYANGNGQIVFQKVFADGTPDGSPVINPGGGNGYAYYLFPSSLVFDGTYYEAAFIGNDGTSGYWQVIFMKLDLNFNPVVTAERVSSYGVTQTFNSYWPQIAAGGGQYCIVWYDGRSGWNQVYATLLNSNGTVANAGASHDILLSGHAANQQEPSVAWSPVGANGTGGFEIVWQDYRNSKWEILGEEWSACCGLNYLNTIVSSTAQAQDPHLAYGPNWAGLAWDDTRDGNTEIYFALMDKLGYKSGSDIRLTNDPNIQNYPFVSWTGAQFGVFYSDSRYGGGEMGFQGVSANGALVGGNTQATYGLGLCYVSAAFAKLGFLGAGYVSQNPNYAEPVGCNYASAPPCPSNMFAYGITGSSATISWQASNDPYTDIAFYAVYRDNALVGKTSRTYFADTGLSLSTTYNYLVNAVNAAELASSGCGSTNSFYLKTNATLTLAVSKSDPNALLTWTDSSGQTLPSYNVYRGESPQVLRQVASSSTGTYSDPNALTDNVLYFYSVDEPGQ